MVGNPSVLLRLNSLGVISEEEYQRILVDKQHIGEEGYQLTGRPYGTTKMYNRVMPNGKMSIMTVKSQTMTGRY